MNKKEAIKEINNLEGLTILDKTINFNSKMIPKKEVFNIINQIDEPDKPVVPQFVAEYIEYCKHEKFYALHGAYDNMDDRLTFWRFKGNNSELFAKAWLYGYEVEKEKLYTVEIPNPNSKGTNKIYLCKDDTTGKVYLCKGNFNPSKNRNLRLTESEIKQDFAWAWQFAKEVE